MRIHYVREYADCIARENIKRGDLLTQIWDKYLRKSRKGDLQPLGFALKNYKKGEIVTDVSMFGTAIIKSLER